MKKKINYKNKYKFFILIATFLVVFLFLQNFKKNDYDNFAPNQDDYNLKEKDNSSLLIEKSVQEEKKNVLPVKVLLEVPFLSQAPFQKWDFLHENACEEASLIMLKYFKDKISVISPQVGEKEIQNLIRYETMNNYKESISLEELKEIAEKYYKMKNGRIEYNVLSEDIKEELAKGNPVIIPAAGKILPNPNFRNGGPDYHMLVIKGYDEKEFITNDPGTRKGENFRYSFSDLEKAIHNWDDKDILKGEKAYLVFD